MTQDKSWYYVLIMCSCCTTTGLDSVRIFEWTLRAPWGLGVRSYWRNDERQSKLSVTNGIPSIPLLVQRQGVCQAKPKLWEIGRFLG